MTRAKLLASLASAPLLSSLPPVAGAVVPPGGATTRAGSALVLSGGGARGAYEAGIVEGLVQKAGISDGQLLPGVDIVCGTSIGSVNAWFVATAQYSQLKALWAGIAAEHVFELKRRFAATAKPGAFVVNRIVAALSLATGLTKNVRGVLDGDNVAKWLARHVDPRTTLQIPYILTVTDLDRQRSEIFYRLPFVADPGARAAATTRIRATYGTRTSIREAGNDILLTAIQASAAIPVLFDPIDMPAPEGGTDRYIDGGIADNAPIDIARALATSVYAVLLDPVTVPREEYRNALEVGVGAFSVAQRRILEASLRATYLATQEKRLFERVATTDRQKAYEARIFDTDLFTVRPENELPVEVAEFDRQEKIDAAYAAGVRDIAAGWRPYTLPD